MSSAEGNGDVMSAYTQAADVEIEAAIARLDERRTQEQGDAETVRLPLVDKVGVAVAQLIAAQLGRPEDAATLSQEVSDSLTTPPPREDYPWKPDYGLHAFHIARSVGAGNPVAFAAQLGEAAQQLDIFSQSGNIGPFVNLRIDNGALNQEARQAIDSKEAQPHDGKVVFVEFSSPNIAKPFGINHLRSTIIGESIARIKEEAGHVVVRDNHLGDWGTQFGNLLAAYDEFGGSTPFEDLSVDQLNELYVRFSAEKKDNPELVFKGRDYFRRLSEKDPDLLQRWHAAVTASRAEFADVYARLGITFDTQVGEAYFESDAEKLLTTLENDTDTSADGNIIFGEDGTAYIDGEHPVVLRTQEGYCVYAARDLATVDMRTKRFQPDEMIYVVGEEQSTSFSAMFEAAQKLGLSEDGVELVHADFGLLLSKNRKKLSSREGTSGKLVELLDELEARSYDNLRERNDAETEDSLRQNAKILGLDALIWNDLQTDRKKSVVFDPERMLALGKGGVIDALYAYLRSNKIIEKFDPDNTALNDTLDTLTNEAEHDLAVTIGDFPHVVKQASEANSPHLLVTYLQNLNRRHGVFYEQSPVAHETDSRTRNTRLMLHRSFMAVMDKGLHCLNIQVPDYL